jgi:hypothetical protein
MGVNRSNSECANIKTDDNVISALLLFSVEATQIGTFAVLVLSVLFVSAVSRRTNTLW